MAKRLNYQIGFTGDTSQLEASLAKATQALDALMSRPNRMSKEFREAAQAAADLSLHLKNSQNAVTGQLDLVAFNKNLAKAGISLSDYGAKLTSIGAEGQEAFLKVAQGIAAAELPIRRSSAALDQLWITMKNTMRWQISSTMLHRFIGSIQTAYNYSKDLNESLNSIRIVTQKTVEDMDRFAQKANEAARALSTTTQRYSEASLIYFQQGLDDETVEARTNITIKLANAAGESAEKASEQLTAVWNNFAKGADDLEHYADVLTALGASTASSTEEISSGIQKFAAVANTVGLSYEYATSALATLTATTRESADTVGTALRTIFGRLESLKLGETLEDDTSLAKYSEALMKVGVDIKDASGNLKDMDEILDETMAKWQLLDRNQRVALAQTVAGVRQYAQFMALMDNSKFFKQNLETARNAEGSLNRQADIFAESWEAARNRVRSAAEEIYKSLFNEQVFIAADNALAVTLNRFSDMIDAAGGLKGVLLIVSNLMMTAYGDKMAQGMRNVVYNLQQQLGLNDAIAVSMKERSIAILNNAVSIQNEEVGLQGQVELNKQLSELQLDLVKNAKNLTDEQTLQVKNTIDQIKSIKEVADGYAEAARNAHELQQESLGALKYASTGKFNRDNAEAYLVGDSKAVERQRHIVKSAILGGKLDETNRIKDAKMLDALGTAKGYNNLERALEGVIKRFNELNQLRQRTDSTDKTKIDNLNEEIALQKEYANVIGNTLKAAYPELKSEIDKLLSSMGQLDQSTKNFSRTTEDLINHILATRQEIQEMANAQMDWASKIVAAGRALSQLGMAVNAITSLLDTWNPENDLSTIERFTRTIMSLSMILPILNTALTRFGVIQKANSTTQTIYNVLMGKENAENVKGVTAKLALSVAQKAVNRANTEGVVATTANTEAEVVAEGVAQALATVKAEEALAIESARAAMIGYLASAGAVIAIVGALGLAIYGLVKWYNQDADAAKAATKAHEEASKKAQEANEAYRELLSTISGYDAAVAAIDDLTVGTDEYREAVAKANEEALKLLETNEALRTSSYYDDRGVLIVDQNYARRLARQKQVNANNVSNFTGIEEQRASLQAQATALRRKTPSLSQVALHVDHYYDDRHQGHLNFHYEKTEQQEFDEAIDSLITNGINPLSQLGQYSSNVAEALEKLSPEITKWIRTQSEVNQELFRYKQEIARNSLSLVEGYDNLSGKEQNMFANIVAANMTDENIANVREQIRQGFLTSSATVNYKGDRITTGPGATVVPTLNIQALRDEYTSLGGGDWTGLSADDLLEYVQDARLYEGIIESINFDNLQRLGDEAMSNVIEGWISTGFKTVDMSEISPVLRDKILLQEGNLREPIEKLAGTAGDSFFATLKNNYSIEPWINAQKAGFEELVISLKAVEDAATIAFGKISDGELLTEEDIANLQTAFGDKVDFTGFETLAVEDQIRKLQELTEANAESTEQLDEYYKELEKIQKELAQINDDEDSEFAKSLREALEELEDRIEAIKKDFEKNPWKVKIETEGADKIIDTRAIAANVANLRKAFQLINDDLTISQENLVELGKRYPEAVTAAYYDEAANVLRIDEEKYNQLKANAYEGLETNRDVSAQHLLDEAKTEAAIVSLVGLAEEYKRGESSKTVSEAIAGNEDLERTAVEASKRIVLQAIEDEISKRQANKQTFLETGAQTEATEQTITSSLKAIENNSEIAARQFREYFIQALESVGTEFAYWVAHPTDYVRVTTGSSIRKVYNQAWQTGEQKTPEQVKAERESNPYYIFQQRNIDDLNALKAALQNENWDKANELRESLFDRGVIDSSLVGMIGGWTGANDVNLGGKFLDTYGASSAGSTVKSDAQAVFDEINNVLADLLEPQSKDKSGSGGRSSSEKDLTKFEEHYHEINALLERQQKLLQENQTAIDRTYGTQKLALYTQRLKLLNEQLELQKRKQAEAENGFGREVDSLRAKATELGLSAPEIQNGLLSNYTKLMIEATKQLNKAEKQYNVDFNEEAYNLAKKRYDEFVDLIKKVEDASKVISDLKADIVDTAREQADAQLSSLNYQLQIKLDVRDLRKQINDFSRSIAESTGDALNQIPKVAPLNTEDAETELALYDEYLQKYSEYKSILANADEYTNIDATREAMEELTSQIISSGENLLEWLDYWENMVPDAVAAAADRFSAFTDQLAHNSTVLDSIKELYALQGQTYKTQKGFERLQKVSQERMKASTATAQLQRKWFENSQRELEEAQKALDAYKGVEGTAEYDFLKKQRDAFLEQFNASQEAYLSAAIDALNAAKDIYVEQIEKAAYDFGQKMVEGLGATDLSMLQEQYDHFIEVEEEYFDEVNSAYHQTTWYNKIEAEIANSTNKAYQERLALFKEEVVAKRTSAEFDQYDLDVIEARYKILQAEAALEEAKNNATSLSLVRDSQGNWNYRYVADQKEIDKAQQNVLDAQNEYYNLTKKRTKEVTKSIIDNWNDCQEAIKALQELGIEDEEEYRQREAEIREYYGERNRYLLAEQAQAIDDMTQAGSESISNFDNTYAQSLSSMTTNGQNFEQALDKALEQCRSHFGEFQTTTKDVADKTGTELDELSTDVSEVSTATYTLKRKGQECADALYSKIGKISDVAQSYRDLAGDIQKAIDKIEKLARVQGKDIEESYNNGNKTGVESNNSSSVISPSKATSTAAVDTTSDMDISSSPVTQVQKSSTTTPKIRVGWEYKYVNEDIHSIFEVYSDGTTHEAGTSPHTKTNIKTGGGSQKYAFYCDKCKTWIYRSGSRIGTSSGPTWAPPAGFASGGYTGTWGGDAKLAFLHEKELVLNQEDTRNMLAAVAMVRDIARALDGNVQAAIGQMASLVSGFIAPAASQNTSTTNYFDVNFPNAVYASEIEEALNNLINNAEQYAGGA